MTLFADVSIEIIYDNRSELKLKRLKIQILMNSLTWEMKRYDNRKIKIIKFLVFSILRLFEDIPVPNIKHLSRDKNGKY
jgi:hypothetical protein